MHTRESCNRWMTPTHSRSHARNRCKVARPCRNYRFVSLTVHVRRASLAGASMQPERQRARDAMFRSLVSRLALFTCGLSRFLPRWTRFRAVTRLQIGVALAARAGRTVPAALRGPRATHPATRTVRVPRHALHTVDDSRASCARAACRGALADVAHAVPAILPGRGPGTVSRRRRKGRRGHAAGNGNTLPRGEWDSARRVLLRRSHLRSPSDRCRPPRRCNASTATGLSTI